MLNLRKRFKSLVFRSSIKEESKRNESKNHRKYGS